MTHRYRARWSVGRGTLRTFRGWSLAVILGAACPLYSSQARAQDDTMVAMARERFQEGVKYYDAKQYEKARAAFLQAYALKRHPAVLLNLAQSELRSAHEADAAEHFDLYLRENKEASALERQEAEKGLAAAKAKVGAIEVRVEDGAEIYVDGQPEGRSPLPAPVYVTPGKHTVEARKGGQVANAQVDATAGRSVTATLALGGAGGSAAPAGAVPASGGTADQTPGGAGAEGPAEADTGGESVAFDTSQPREPFFTWAARNKVAWIGGGVTLLGIGGAIGFSLVAKSHFDAANDFKTQITDQAASDNLTRAPCDEPRPNQQYDLACNRFADEASSGNTFETLTFVSIGVAVAAAGFTVVYYFVDTGKKSTASEPPGAQVAVVPLASPTAGGLSFVGQF